MTVYNLGLLNHKSKSKVNFEKCKKRRDSKGLSFFFIFLKKRFMNFQIFYDKVRQYALNTQKVNSFYTLDPYTCWNSLNVTYGSFSSNINYIRRSGGYDIVNVSFYFGDKLKNDSSNIFEVQTDGFRVIMNVINHLKDEYEIEDFEDIQVHPFFQQFSDILAGCYCDLNIYVPVEDTCANFDKE